MAVLQIPDCSRMNTFLRVFLVLWSGPSLLPPLFYVKVSEAFKWMRRQRTLHKDHFHHAWLQDRQILSRLRVSWGQRPPLKDLWISSSHIVLNKCSLNEWTLKNPKPLELKDAFRSFWPSFYRWGSKGSRHYAAWPRACSCRHRRTMAPLSPFYNGFNAFAILAWDVTGT